MVAGAALVGGGDHDCGDDGSGQANCERPGREVFANTPRGQGEEEWKMDALQEYVAVQVAGQQLPVLLLVLWDRDEEKDCVRGRTRL